MMASEEMQAPRRKLSDPTSVMNLPTLDKLSGIDQPDVSFNVSEVFFGQHLLWKSRTRLSPLKIVQQRGKGRPNVVVVSASIDKGIESAKVILDPLFLDGALIEALVRETVDAEVIKQEQITLTRTQKYKVDADKLTEIELTARVNAIATFVLRRMDVIKGEPWAKTKVASLPGGVALTLKLLASDKFKLAEMIFEKNPGVKMEVQKPEKRRPSFDDFQMAQQECSKDVKAAGSTRVSGDKLRQATVEQLNAALMAFMSSHDRPKKPFAELTNAEKWQHLLRRFGYRRGAQKMQERLQTSKTYAQFNEELHAIQQRKLSTMRRKRRASTEW